MAKTEAQRRAVNKWDAANMKILACKVKREKAEAFQSACKKEGTTPNAVFIKAIDNFMDAPSTPEKQESPAD